MARKRQHTPLHVLLNNRLVGHLEKAGSGAMSFRYDESWVSREGAIPVSLSLPVREDLYKGEPVAAFFDNLLPDSNDLRRRLAGKVGAAGSDAHSLLTQIGRDCVGALQFVPADGVMESADKPALEGRPVSDAEIEDLLKNLSQAPLGLDRDRDFRISVAGAQEKTALLWHQGQWLQPRGTTPTSHLFKVQIGTLPNGLDLSNSVENEYYCLKLMQAFGLRVNAAEIRVFGRTKALVIERFDRRWMKDGQLLRLPQEDCCQALSIPPGMKYQNEGGPGMADILELLRGSDSPLEDQHHFLKAQILFWLMGATDGHAKNFSVFLGPGGSFRMTPFYDVLTAQPSLDARQIHKKDVKLAMSAGDNRHYRLDMIRVRHFMQTAARAGLPAEMARAAFDEIKSSAETAFERVEKQLPARFPQALHASVRRGFFSRLKSGET